MAVLSLTWESPYLVRPSLLLRRPPEDLYSIIYPSETHVKHKSREISICPIVLSVSALLQLHFHSRLNIWLQLVGQEQLQDETRNIKVLGFCATYIRSLTVFHEIRIEDEFRTDITCCPTYITYTASGLTMFAPSQWETALLYNHVSRWMGVSQEWALQPWMGQLIWQGTDVHNVFR